MKTKILYTIALGLIFGFSIPVMAQPDTLTKQGIGTFEDPKITDDNSKILIDTTVNVDSLMEKNKLRRQPQIQPAKEDEAVRSRRAPMDTMRMVRP
jgi:hypothetical protein